MSFELLDTLQRIVFGALGAVLLCTGSLGLLRRKALLVRENWISLPLCFSFALSLVYTLYAGAWGGQIVWGVSLTMLVIGMWRERSSFVLLGVGEEGLAWLVKRLGGERPVDVHPRRTLIRSILGEPRVR